MIDEESTTAGACELYTSTVNAISGVYKCLHAHTSPLVKLLIRNESFGSAEVAVSVL